MFQPGPDLAQVFRPAGADWSPKFDQAAGLRNRTVTASVTVPSPGGVGAKETVPVPEHGRTRVVGIARATPYARRSTGADASWSNETRIAVAPEPVSPPP